jgi:hypothetical protein
MISGLLQWCAENVEGMLALLTIAAALISLLVKAGAIQKERGEVLTQLVEDSEGVAKRALDLLADAREHTQLTGSELEAIEATGLKGEARKRLMDAAKNKLTNVQIAAAFAKAMKGEARERAVKTGLKSVFVAVAQGAARADPKKDNPSLGSRIGNVLRARIPFLGG